MRALLAAASVALAVGGGLHAKEVSTLLADLPAEVERALDPSTFSTADPQALLQRVFSAAPSYHFEAGLVGVDTDRRWFQTLPPDVPGTSVLEIRRWPGDTVLALYPLEGESPAEQGPRLRGAKLTRRPGEGAAGWRWDGTLETTLGTREIAWIEFPVPGVARRLGILLVPGDAGLGTSATADLVQELLAVVGRIELRPEAFSLQPGIPAGATLVPPTLDAAPGAADERKDTWQVVDGGSYTLGLPPGMRARRLDQGVPPPRSVPSSILWLRGRFLDRRGEAVEVGDGVRTGYLAVLSSLDGAWSRGERAPLAAPAAKRLAGEDFTIACEQTGAEAARAERWSEAGFAGEWLVFRLLTKSSGIEIGLPILAGRQSEALFWIPTTLRAAGAPPAPPPLDPADRFGIVYKQFSRIDQGHHPGLGGSLLVPGLRLDLPLGWIPITTLRSEDGFPVLLVDGHGRTMGQLFRVAAGSSELLAPEEAGWTPTRKRSKKSGSVYERADGARSYVGVDGNAVLLVPDAGAGSGAEWQRLVDSAALLRTRTAKPPAEEAR